MKKGLLGIRWLLPVMVFLLMSSLGDAAGRKSDIPLESVPIGYRITLAVFGKNMSPRYETFAEGWLQGDKAWGRPVDIVEMTDGSLLVSDDKAGVIYRISYHP